MVLLRGIWYFKMFSNLLNYWNKVEVIFFGVIDGNVVEKISEMLLRYGKCL